MLKKSNYIKNGLIAGALSLPLLFGGCYKVIHPVEGQKETTITSIVKEMHPKSLESIIKKESKKFHEELTDEEYNLLTEKYGNNDRAVYFKLADKNFALYGKSLIDFDIYTNIEANENKAYNDVVWYSVFNDNLVEIGRKTIATSGSEADILIELLNKQTGYLIDFYNRGDVSIYRNNESNDYDQLYRGTTFAILNSSYVRFKDDNNPAKLGKDGRIITDDLRTIDKLSESDLEKMESFWDAIYF